LRMASKTRMALGMVVNQFLRCRSGQHLPLILDANLGASSCRHCKVELTRLPGGSWRAIAQPAL
jgi:hypothetical protein